MKNETEGDLINEHMKKLTDVVYNVDGSTFGGLLERIIEDCEQYKKDIDNPDSLDEVWQKVKECPADPDKASKLFHWISEVWSVEQHLKYQSNFGFRFRPLFDNLGLAISTLTMIKELRARGYGVIEEWERSKELKDLQVGEQIVLEVREKQISCKGCFLRNITYKCSAYGLGYLPCDARVRSDNKDIIFIEKKEKKV